MSRRNDRNTIDELPELRSDAEVDALMARLRTKVAPAPLRAAASSLRPAVSDDPVRDLVAAQEGFASTVVRAMQIIAETLEEFEADERATVSPALTSRLTRGASERKRRAQRHVERRKAR